ncbi:MAG: AAA family ATPase [Proteobacteria bacterium]|nr:AAA family ATPase [Pseudomonadota bacterium]MBU4356658.1 AAA family ATPase [Pseudomonadota bacterium]MBU4447396.1 AAA family ATPase [Pseudomonadota bacterium]MCG2771017.1 AAA family ATPase [Desulfobacterales bacterium]
MYNSFFGFITPPFENKLDQRFLFLGRDHEEVLAALHYFTREKKGLAMVCGDVGTGKTMLLQGFLEKLPASVHPIVISNPLVSHRELLDYIATTLEIPQGEETLLGRLDRIKETLIAANDQGETILLIIDEAHLLPDASLEHIRLLFNIETPECKLLQILLVGQYELSHRLNLPQFRALRQRINVNRFLSPLSALETVQYVEHRLERAGSRFDRCFAPGCKKLIWKLTAGVPRRINHLCDTALLICLSKGLTRVNPVTLKEAQDALKTDQIFSARYSFLPRTLSFGKLGKFKIPAMACLLLLALWGMLGSSGFQGGIGQIFQKFWSGAAGSVQARVSPTGASREGSPAAAATKAPDQTPSLAIAPSPSPSGPAVSPAALAQAAPAQLSPPKPEEIPTPPTSTRSPLEAEKKAPALVADEAPGVKIIGPASEGQGAPAPLKSPQEPLDKASFPVQASRPSQVEVKDNDNLTLIAKRWFPQQMKLGVVALLLANPQNLNANLIFPGQKLNLPQIDPVNQTIQMKEGIFYALWGTYPSIPSLQQTISRLSQQNVRYTVMNNDTTKGAISYQVLIGAYASREDLEQALSRVNKQSG